MVSKTPSPYRKLRSVAGTTACSGGTNFPLISAVIHARPQLPSRSGWGGQQEIVPTYFRRKAYAGSGGKFNVAKKPPAFASVSSYSADGIESATMPAPAWKKATP